MLRAQGSPEKKCTASRSSPVWNKCLAEQRTPTTSDPNSCIDVKPRLGVVYGIVDFLGANFGFLNIAFCLRAPLRFAVMVLDVPMKWEVKCPLQFVHLFGSLRNFGLFVFRRKPARFLLEKPVSVWPNAPQELLEDVGCEGELPAELLGSAHGQRRLVLFPLLIQLWQIQPVPNQVCKDVIPQHQRLPIPALGHQGGCPVMAIVAPWALLACWPAPSCALATGLECPWADVLRSDRRRGRSFWVTNILITEAPEGGGGLFKVAACRQRNGMGQTHRPWHGTREGRGAVLLHQCLPPQPLVLPGPGHIAAASAALVLLSARNGAPAPRDVQLLQSCLDLEEFQLLQRTHHAVHLLVQPVSNLLHG